MRRTNLNSMPCKLFFQSICRFPVPSFSLYIYIVSIFLSIYLSPRSSIYLLHTCQLIYYSLARSYYIHNIHESFVLSCSLSFKQVLYKQLSSSSTIIIHYPYLTHAERKNAILKFYKLIRSLFRRCLDYNNVVQMLRTNLKRY